MKINKMSGGYIFLSLILIYFIILTVIYFAQRSLMYHPSENNFLDENKLNHKIKEIKIPSDNELTSWYFKKNENFKTLLFFHGNAELSQEYDQIANYYNSNSINFIVADYRGYGLSSGYPDKDNLHLDSNVIFNYVKKFLKSVDYFI